MPRIPRTTLDTAIYLYPSKEDAEHGEKVGGSGFLVGLPRRKGDEQGWIYAVTNRHVAEQCNVIRLNTLDGGKRVEGAKAWILHPDRKTDLAIASLGVTNLKIYSFQTFMPRFHFIDKTRLVNFEIGVGDDCYMIGRFVNQEGFQKNLPTARFGAIAQMPGEPIWTKWVTHDEAYLVEVRSIAGFSGSPVVVRVPSQRARGVPLGKRVVDDPANDWHMLLGIDCGHSNDNAESLYETGSEEPVKGYEIEYNTGLAIVIPAWKLQELIDCDEAEKMREEESQEYKQRARGVRLDVRAPKQRTSPKEGEPVEAPVPTREGFMRDLTKATRKREKK